MKKGRKLPLASTGFALALVSWVPSFGATLVVHARNDKPMPVEIRVDAKDGQGAILQTTTLSWTADDNSYSDESTTIPSNTRFVRLTFTNDTGGPGPDFDRNAFIDHFAVDGRHYEAIDYTTTGGTDAQFPGCGKGTLDSRRVADCGNQNDWA